MPSDSNSQISSSVTLTEHQDAPAVRATAGGTDASAHDSGAALPGTTADAGFSGGDPTRIPSIKDAWSAAIAEVGELDPDEAPELEAKSKAAASGNKTRGADGKFAPRAAVKQPEEHDAADTASADGAPEEVTDDDETKDVKAEPKKDAKTKVDAKAKADEKSDDVESADASDKRLTAKERSIVIAERQKLRERYQRKESTLNAREQDFAKKLQAAEARFAPAVEFFDAASKGDFDGMATAYAKATGATEVKDWTSLNSEALRAMQSPVYKRMRDLERQREQDRKEQEQTRAQAQAAEQQRAQAAARAELKRDVASQLEADEDDAVAELVSTRPALVDAVLQVQEAHYHRTGGEWLPPREALTDVLQRVRDDFAAWSEWLEAHGEAPLIKTLGFRTPAARAAKSEQAADQTATRRVNSERQTSKKTSGASKVQVQETGETPAIVARTPAASVPIARKTVSQAQTTQASAIRPMTESELKKYTARKMEEEWRQAGFV